MKDQRYCTGPSEINAAACQELLVKHSLTPKSSDSAMERTNDALVITGSWLGEIYLMFCWDEVGIRSASTMEILCQHCC